jgi:peptidoglycan/LPS O-acetylase OafA/YrhL
MIESSDPGRTAMRIAAALAADLACVFTFVIIGRNAHAEVDSAGGILSTAWPFLIGVVGGYVGAAMARWPALSARGAAVIVAKTLILGLVLRYGIQREGTPLSFIIVTVLFLSAFMAGWRLVFHTVHRRRVQHLVRT